MNYKIYTNEEKDAMSKFPKELKKIVINKPFSVGKIKIEPSESPNITTYLVLYDNCELRIRYVGKENGIEHTLAPLQTDDTKLIWQKAQQQCDEKKEEKVNENKNDKRYEEPFEDDGAYAD
jgi:hypothetical protein